MKTLFFFTFLKGFSCALVSSKGLTYDCGGDTVAEQAVIFAEEQMYLDGNGVRSTTRYKHEEIFCEMKKLARDCAQVYDNWATKRYIDK